MFTGLIEAVGTVTKVDRVRPDSKPTTNSADVDGKPVSDTWPSSVILTIGSAGKVLEDVREGDSIATDGVCLTVTSFDQKKDGGSFTVGLAPETLQRSTLQDVKEGTKVNLERAAARNARLGGHIVQGHVDTTATITAKDKDGDSIRYTFQLDDANGERASAGALVPKGYVTIDGTSLTLTDVKVSERKFSIMLIPHTQDATSLSGKNVGEHVNIELDVIAKAVDAHIERLFSDGASIAKHFEQYVQKAISKFTGGSQ